MSRYTDTKKMFREMNSSDLRAFMVYLKLEVKKTKNYMDLLNEELAAADAVMRERRL